MSVELLDSYSESYYGGIIQLIGNGYPYYGQTFYNELECSLDSCKFYARKYGSPTGNAYAAIYEMTGTFGVDGKPVNAALAVSDPLDVTALDNHFKLRTFNFSGINRITLEADTHYCVAIYYTAGDASNDVWIGNDYLLHGIDSHSGNYFLSSNGSSWLSSGSQDTIFYVYGEFADEEPANQGNFLMMFYP